MPPKFEARQQLLVDADDTLWENNVYFERTFHRFCEFLDHSHLTSEQVRQALDEVELVNNQIHGYGSANFGRNMVECYHRLVQRQISPTDADAILQMALEIQEHPLELIDGVRETLEYLAPRHQLILLTKGNRDEQQRKVDTSGVSEFFHHTIIVKEKDVETYRKVVDGFALEPARCWMVGNSPKSDINPAIDAGLGAVYVPHERTWHLERQELAASERLLLVQRFSDLQKIF